MTNQTPKQEVEWWRVTLLDIEDIVRECSEVSPSDHYILDILDLRKQLKIYAKRRTTPKNSG
jgi:hypothetical protein